jgi:hypothetical protein
VRSGLVVVLCLAGCPSPPEKPSQYPAREPGCDIKMFTEIPPMQTDNIGPVMASCDESVSDGDCLRTLKDQACKLGADLIWGVDEVPARSNGKKKLAGRAAHTKTQNKTRETGNP